MFVILASSTRTSGLPVSDVSGTDDGAGGTGPAAEFPGNILEGHGDGRVPGRVGPDASEDSQPGNSCVLRIHHNHHH